MAKGDMTAKEIAGALYAEVVDGNLAEYRHILEGAVETPPRDPYWRKVAALFRSIPDDQKNHFVEIFRQVSVDAVSTVAGVLDGTSPLGGTCQSFTLTDSDGTKLNGCLQDHFLAVVEKSRTG